MRILITLLILNIFLIMCDTTDSDPKPTLTISLTANGPEFSTDGNYPKFGGPEDILTHWVAWIEKADGTFLKTLKVNTSAPTLSKYGYNKLSSLPTWNTASNASNIVSDESITADSVYTEFDGLTAASLTCYGGASATATAEWDLSDVADGIYTFNAEVSTLLKNIDSINSITGDTVFLASDYASRAQSTSGTVSILDGKATVTSAATPTANILSLTAIFTE